MEQLYKNYWADESCLSSAVQVLALSSLIIALVLLLIGLVTWLIVRRQAPTEGRANARVLGIVFGGCGALLAGLAVYMTFFSPTLRRVYVADGGFVVETCEGPRGATTHIAATDVASIDFQWRWSGGKTNKQIDEMVISRRAGEPVIVGLSTDPDVLNLPLLKRVAPSVVAGWIAARRERGWSIPPELAAIE